MGSNLRGGAAGGAFSGWPLCGPGGRGRSGLHVHLLLLGPGRIVQRGTREGFVGFPDALPSPDEHDVHRRSQRARKSGTTQAAKGERGREHRRIGSGNASRTIRFSSKLDIPMSNRPSQLPPGCQSLTRRTTCSSRRSRLPSHRAHAPRGIPHEHDPIVQPRRTPCQNSISRGSTRYPPQCGGRGTGWSSPKRADTSAICSSSAARDATGSDWWLAQADSCEPRGRDAK